MHNIFLVLAVLRSILLSVAPFLRKCQCLGGQESCEVSALDIGQGNVTTWHAFTTCIVCICIGGSLCIYSDNEHARYSGQFCVQVQLYAGEQAHCAYNIFKISAKGESCARI